MKIGFIARIDRGGLAIESQEFVSHMKPDRIMAIKVGDMVHDEKRFPDATIIDGVPSKNDILKFIKGLDVIFSIETFYSPEMTRICRQQGVKTILRINYEWFEPDKGLPDLILTPTLWNWENIPDPKIYLPYPINRSVLPFKLREKANTFLHIAGNMRAGYDRNGTRTFLDAIPLVKNQNIKFIIKSQVNIKGINDKRVKVICKDHKEYWENWQTDADVYVSPRRYAGQSLPLNESMSRGVVPIMPRISPQQAFLPDALLIDCESIDKIQVKQEIEIATIRPIDIAKKIDELAEQDISEYSKVCNEIAQSWSWENLLPKYKEIFKNIC